jgi:hypothetical protein
MSYDQEAAETLALKALAWLAANEELLPTFLGATGASEADVKAQAADPMFLGAMLDFLMMDDTWIVSVCDHLHIPYDRLAMVRQALPGGEQVHWT